MQAVGDFKNAARRSDAAALAEKETSVDDKRFDQIARALGGVTGRRQAVKSIVGGAVATGLGAIGVAAADAKGNGKGKKGKKGKKQGAQGGGSCRGEGHPCTGGQICCPGLICGKAPNPGADVRCCHQGEDCQPVSGCQNDDQCDKDEVCCSGTCVSGVCCTSGDCNSSDKASKKGKHGKAGAAGEGGGGDEACCGHQCVDTGNDPDNCGRCGNQCDKDETCVNGHCTSPTCQGENQYCNNTSKQCCANLTCGDDHKCHAAGCSSQNPCDAGQVCCDGTCYAGECCGDKDCNDPGICQDTPGTCNTDTHTCSYDNADNGTPCGQGTSKARKAKGKAHAASQPSGDVCCDGACVECCTSEDCGEGETCNDQHQCVPTCGGDGDACDGSNPCCGGLVCNKDTLKCQPSVTCNPACDKNNCEFCNNVTGQCVSACGANTTCDGSGQCVGSGGTCDATHCDPNNCLQCNESGDCVPTCSSGETCDGSGNCLPGGCTSDDQCGPGGICLEGICFVTSTCPTGQSNLDCCRNAVKKACHNQGGKPAGGGGLCRRKGKKRCKKNFGTA
jgi:hypothetical protein